MRAELTLGIQMDDTTGQVRGWWEVVVVAVITLTVVSVADYGSGGKLFRRKRLPPGPRRWPVVGSLLSVDAGALPHQDFHNLSKQYGPLMFLRLGSSPTVVVTNAEMAEVVLKTKDHVLASRPDTTMAVHKIFSNGDSFGFAPMGPYWRNMRKFCSAELFSVNRVKQFQVPRQREVLEMLHSILVTSQQQGIVTVNDFLSNMMTNIVTQMLLGKSYCSTKSDSKSGKLPFSFLATMMRETSHLMVAFNIGDFIPILKRLDLQGYNKQFEAFHVKWDTFLESVLEDHRQQSLTNEKSNENFLDALLAHTVSNDPKCDVGEPLPKDNIKRILMELLIAGTEAPSVTVEWALAELLKNPSTLRRAQEELDFVVGKHRLVNEDDIPQLKYIQAVVKETFRLHPPTPLSVPHAATESCEIAGYHLPATSQIIINLYGIQRDPLVWERPLQFDPDRFLSTTRTTTDVKGRNFDLLPFGSGRRACVGMSLGLLMVQYPLAQLLHIVDLALPEGQKPEELDMSESFGVNCAKAIPLRVLAKPRLSTDVIYPAYIS